jgi:hypothetical protein
MQVIIIKPCDNLFLYIIAPFTTFAAGGLKTSLMPKFDVARIFDKLSLGNGWPVKPVGP